MTKDQPSDWKQKRTAWGQETRALPLSKRMAMKLKGELPVTNPKKKLSGTWEMNRFGHILIKFSDGKSVYIQSEDDVQSFLERSGLYDIVPGDCDNLQDDSIIWEYYSVATSNPRKRHMNNPVNLTKHKQNPVICFRCGIRPAGPRGLCDVCARGQNNPVDYIDRIQKEEWPKKTKYKPTSKAIVPYWRGKVARRNPDWEFMNDVEFLREIGTKVIGIKTEKHTRIAPGYEEEVMEQQKQDIARADRLVKFGLLKEVGRSKHDRQFMLTEKAFKLISPMKNPSRLDPWDKMERVREHELHRIRTMSKSSLYTRIGKMNRPEKLRMFIQIARERNEVGLAREAMARLRELGYRANPRKYKKKLHHRRCKVCGAKVLPERGHYAKLPRRMICMGCGRLERLCKCARKNPIAETILASIAAGAASGAAFAGMNRAFGKAQANPYRDPEPTKRGWYRHNPLTKQEISELESQRDSFMEEMEEIENNKPIQPEELRRHAFLRGKALAINDIINTYDGKRNEPQEMGKWAGHKANPVSNIKLVLKRKSATNEWVVAWYENGKYSEKKSYYTNDKQDAIDTMASMKRRYRIAESNPYALQLYGKMKEEKRKKKIFFDIFDWLIVNDKLPDPGKSAEIKHENYHIEVETNKDGSVWLEVTQFDNNDNEIFYDSGNISATEIRISIDELETDGRIPKTWGYNKNPRRKAKKNPSCQFYGRSEVFGPNCPKCKTPHMRIDTTMSGQKYTCAKCGHSFDSYHPNPRRYKKNPLPIVWQSKDGKWAVVQMVPHDRYYVARIMPDGSQKGWPGEYNPKIYKSLASALKLAEQLWQQSGVEHNPMRPMSNSDMLNRLNRAASDCKAKHGSVYIYVDDLYDHYFSGWTLETFKDEMEKLYREGLIKLDMGCPIGRDMKFMLQPIPGLTRTTFTGLGSSVEQNPRASRAGRRSTMEANPRRVRGVPTIRAAELISGLSPGFLYLVQHVIKNYKPGQYGQYQLWPTDMGIEVRDTISHKILFFVNYRLSERIDVVLEDFENRYSYHAPKIVYERALLHKFEPALEPAGIVKYKKITVPEKKEHFLKASNTYVFWLEKKKGIPYAQYLTLSPENKAQLEYEFDRVLHLRRYRPEKKVRNYVIEKTDRYAIGVSILPGKMYRGWVGNEVGIKYSQSYRFVEQALEWIERQGYKIPEKAKRLLKRDLPEVPVLKSQPDIPMPKAKRAELKTFEPVEEHTMEEGIQKAQQNPSAPMPSQKEVEVAVVKAEEFHDMPPNRLRRVKVPNLKGVLVKLGIWPSAPYFSPKWGKKNQKFAGKKGQLYLHEWGDSPAQQKKRLVVFKPDKKNSEKGWIVAWGRGRLTPHGIEDLKQK